MEWVEYLDDLKHKKVKPYYIDLGDNLISEKLISYNKKSKTFKIVSISLDITEYLSERRFMHSTIGLALKTNKLIRGKYE